MVECKAERLADTFSSTAFLRDFIQSCSDQILAGNMTKVLHELLEAKEFDFREIGDHLYDGIYLTDGQGKTLYVNKAYTRITGIKPEEVIGKCVTELSTKGIYANAVTPEVLKQRKQVNSMAESQRKRNKMLVTGNPIFDDIGDIKKVVVIDREISDLLGIKAELESSQKKIKAVEADKNKRKQEIEHLRRLNLNQNLLGDSAEIRKIVKAINQVSGIDVTVLITGETGAGKEVVANEIYRNSPRKNGPFIKVNCAAIPSSLLEAELFGYEKGAFTGATNTGKLGMFELADKGALLLDEIGDIPLELQSKLLRVIQHKELTRIGGTKPVKLDVRIISSTNGDLLSLVKQGKFREDLYYRLNVFPIHMPPLRSRVGDIELLTNHFLNIYNSKYGKNTKIEESGLEVLKQYSWPGNIRELQNVIERLVIVSEYSTFVEEEQIASLLNIEPYYGGVVKKEASLKEIVQNVEKKTIEKVLSMCGSTRKASKILKIDQSTIVKKAKKLGIILTDEKTHRM
ncbi:MAG: norR 15 [Firmicutes bacterium]|nr:norR 15 [Bacillota bacterium]